MHPPCSAVTGADRPVQKPELKEEEAMDRDRNRVESGTDRAPDPRRDDEIREGTVPSDRSVEVGRSGAMASRPGARDPWLASHFDFMSHFMREMSRMFEGFPGSVGQNYSLSRWPPIEVLERDDRVVVRAEMPGMRREDVRVRVEHDSLVIEGERKGDREVRHEGYYESEWSYGRFSRRVTLPAQVDPERVNARYDNGILEITLDLPARARREIPITGSEAREMRETRDVRTESPLRAAERGRESAGSVRP
jgi:HSP20 family protein